MKFKKKLSQQLVKHHAMKMYGVWRNISTYSWRRLYMEVNEIHAQAALPPGMNPNYSLARRLVDSVWTVYKREESLPCRESNFDSPVVQLAA
jgi:hypothetical protein